MELKLPQKIKDELWWLIISVDYDCARITIAEHALDSKGLTLWLEDKNDFKNSLDECLALEVDLKNFAKIIRTANLNSYEGAKMHPKKNFVYRTRIEINEPIKWYREDASATEQSWAREVVLRQAIDNLLETAH